MYINRNDLDLKDLPHLNNLLKVLSENSKDLSTDQFNRILSQRNFEVVSGRDERHAYLGREKDMVRPPIEAVASVHFSKALLSCFGYIDDVVVNPEIQSKGLGTNVTKELILMAKERGAKWVGLTSAPKRAAANKIYSRLMRRIFEAKVFIFKPESRPKIDYALFLDYSSFAQVVDPSDVYVVNTFMGRKAFISNQVVLKYPPASVLEMVWLAIAKGADSIEVILDCQNSVVANLLLQRWFIEKETNVYMLEF